MAMQFDEFVRKLDDAVRALGPVDRYEDAQPVQVAWSSGSRRAAVVLVPPLNVSLALSTSGGSATTTWYPVDEALVPVVSRRIAGYLSES